MKWIEVAYLITSLLIFFLPSQERLSLRRAHKNSADGQVIVSRVVSGSCQGHVRVMSGLCQGHEGIIALGFFKGYLHRHFRMILVLLLLLLLLLLLGLGLGSGSGSGSGSEITA